MPSLFPIRGRNGFCGPAAVASTLGVSTDHAARVIRRFSGGSRTTGVHDKHLVSALLHLGAQVRLIPLGEGYECLASWLHANLDRFQAQQLIFAFGTATDAHYGSICAGMYQCNITGRPVAFEDIPQAAHAGTVFSVIEVLARPERIPQDEAVSDRAMLQKAKLIGARHGISILGAGGVYEVYCPELEHDDPLEGQTQTDDVTEVMALVLRYREFLEGGYLEAVTDPCLY